MAGYRETIDVFGNDPGRFVLRPIAKDVNQPGGAFPGLHELLDALGLGPSGPSELFTPEDLLNTPPGDAPVAQFPEEITVVDKMPPPTTPMGIPVPPQLAPPQPSPGPRTPPPEEPMAGEVPTDQTILGPLPPWAIALLPELVKLGLPVGQGVPNPDGTTGLPDWLEKLLKGLLLAGALAPQGGGGSGGPVIQGGGVVGGGAGGGPMGIGTTNYGGMRGGGNFVGWNPGHGASMLSGGGGGNATGDMIATLFAGRR